MLQANPNPPQAVRAPRETEPAVRTLASVAAVIALALQESSLRHAREESDLKQTSANVIRTDGILGFISG